MILFVRLIKWLTIKASLENEFHFFDNIFLESKTNKCIKCLIFNLSNSYNIWYKLFGLSRE